MELQDLQNKLGFTFTDTNLLQIALTHRSFVNEKDDEDIEDNERLEYLGDAILDFITADMLYRRFPNMTEGELTRLRSALVRTESLALFAQEIELGEALAMGKGEANTGGRERNSNLAGGFEAFIGALYLDQGLETVKEFVIPRLTALQKEVMEEAIRKDPRTLFQELIQAQHSITPEYQTVSSSGPEHDIKFTVSVLVGDTAIAEGYGRTKRAAAQSAAQAALTRLENGEIIIISPKPSPELTDAESTE